MLVFLQAFDELLLQALDNCLKYMYMAIKLLDTCTSSKQSDIKVHKKTLLFLCTTGSMGDFETEIITTYYRPPLDMVQVSPVLVVAL